MPAAVVHIRRGDNRPVVVNTHEAVGYLPQPQVEWALDERSVPEVGSWICRPRNPQLHYGFAPPLAARAYWVQASAGNVNRVL
jgi:hypothetical protein